MSSFSFLHAADLPLDSPLKGLDPEAPVERIRRATRDALVNMVDFALKQRVEFVLTSRDVNHSFWVPQFLMKMDVLPGKVNRFQIKPTEIGVFQGKCAELCGTYHSQMLFQVKVVSQADFDAHMSALKAQGNLGLLDNSLNRSKIAPGDQQFLPKAGGS